jgi:peroxiredoxin
MTGSDASGDVRDEVQDDMAGEVQDQARGGTADGGQGLALGGPAPDFTLRDQFGADTSLSGFRGRKAVLILFYPYAFSGVCSGEMSQLRDRLAEFVTFDSEVLAISCDPIYSLRSWADAEGLNFPLLSDFWPHGEVARTYGVLDEATGAPRRSSYLVDKAGDLAWAVHNALPEGRDMDEHLARLHAVM